jgi:signal transduction histidine kinase
MRLRSVLTLAFIGLAVAQVAVVVPLALKSLSSLLDQQLQARITQLMVAADAETARLEGDVRRRMDELASSRALEDVARDAARTPPPPHVTQAAVELMEPRGLDVLALLDDEGRTLSSGHLPARLGEPDDPLFVVTRVPKTVQPALVELSSAAGLTQAPVLVMARAVDYGDRRVWAVGGVRLGQSFAAALSRLTGATVAIASGGSTVAEVGSERGGVVRSRSLGEVATVTYRFSRADFFATRRQVLGAFLALAAIGLGLSIALGFAVSARVSRPVDALTGAAKQIAQGAPGVVVDPREASGELKVLVETFNRMTTDLKAATDRLVASERIAAWQEVARRLAHEIKNPLTPIRMSLETLLAASQRGPLDERFRGLFTESARAVLEEVDRLKRIVDEFGQFARLPRPTLVELDLQDTVQPVMALYAPHQGRSYELELASGVRVRADRDQLTQVLVNLVKNAEESMSEGGRVTVRVAAEGPLAVLEVEDEGPGIPPELKGRLFEPYVTSKPQGTGLGLAIAQRIAQEHGGQLTARDAPRRGTIFRLVLPRYGK